MKKIFVLLISAFLFIVGNGSVFADDFYSVSIPDTEISAEFILPQKWVIGAKNQDNTNLINLLLMTHEDIDLLFSKGVSLIAQDAEAAKNGTTKLIFVMSAADMDISAINSLSYLSEDHRQQLCKMLSNQAERSKAFKRIQAALELSSIKTSDAQVFEHLDTKFLFSLIKGTFSETELYGYAYSGIMNGNAVIITMLSTDPAGFSLDEANRIMHSSSYIGIKRNNPSTFFYSLFTNHTSRRIIFAAIAGIIFVIFTILHTKKQNIF